MSKAFEMLQNIEAERGVTLGPVPVNGHRMRASVVDQEEISRLVQRLFRVPSAPRSVLFAGIDAGDGCSSICAAAAENLAATAPVSVCLVDGNLRNPSIHKMFELDNTSGLTQAVSQQGAIQNFTRRVAGTNLWVLPAGSGSANALAGSEAMRVRIAELRETFDHVLIDSPAINRYPDAMAIGRMVDGLLLVLQSNATRRETARNVIDSMRSANVNLLGAVLNKRTFPIPQNLYERL